MRAAPLAFLILIACKSGKIPFGDVEDADDVEDLCDEYEAQIEDDTLEIIFAATTSACPWGQDDNGTEQEGVITARVEQQEELDIDDDVLLCDLDLDMTGLVPDQVQFIVFDDQFYFTFNDVVLASSHAPSVDSFDTEDGMPIYDWDDVLGTVFDNGEDSFCLGEAEGDADCDIPDTQTEGPISLAFAQDIINELSARAFDEGRFEFGFVTTGDDNHDTDCMHAEFGFTVDVEYLED